MARKIIRRLKFWIPITMLVAIHISMVVWATEKGFPSKPIQLIIPYAPGGVLDIGGKTLAELMGKILGHPLVSQFKPGGGGSLGAAFVARAKPDGYTILAGSLTPLVLSPIVKKMDYQLEDFIPLGIYGETPIWLAVKTDARWKTLTDFIEDARRSPGQIKISSFGKLTSADFVIEFLNRNAKTQLTHVPYKSSAEALTAVLGGHAEAAMVVGAGGLLESKSVRILALAGENRLEDLPDVPTFKELGYPIALSSGHSFCVPRGTPKEVVEKLAAAQKKAFEWHGDEIKQSLRKVEIWTNVMGPEESMARYKKDYDLLYRLAEELGAVAK